ncbi:MULTISPECIES: cytochrome c-type biogenesis protein [unclassified Candidatus Frackibacter]|uniref:cytochrome c-type biogenesis protein n=1 Tax=unclassified Candidatus Frackibacter TaxID=2648818 RepID=UPI0007995A41|nr:MULTISPECIES: cytochrome c-type biogenesis protein CcmH [unclassified Candidatus Frackibacter]KXS43927.1 MAG: cytochrome c-type bioproteinis protein CcmH [Candidatus Frackibacter sp. T328-2]SDC40149.1 cytochrome c-type biogenesis protein CcmH [Candidatus Frackibacter sp. WG11]SEM60606.1 cytochrome c-type biogenesis protein CcmH [Candidatus Frackibacter sp. WG12]SFL61346.1 cytochrome c-type biogenesis protein CcmH [Candidatus Frackibacter sp. WG13]
MRKKIATILVLVSIMVVFTSAVSYALTVKDVAKEIKMVGCEMLVSVCRTDAANEMRNTIAGMVDKGMTKKEIITSFIEKYGEQVYAAPTKKGFNLIAWIMPFLAIIVGGGVIYYFARQWSAAYEFGTSNKTTEHLSKEEEEEYKEQLDEEFKKYL